METRRTDLPTVRRPVDDAPGGRPQNAVVSSLWATRLAAVIEDGADE
jgi:hypothetical protein